MGVGIARVAAAPEPGPGRAERAATAELLSSESVGRGGLGVGVVGMGF